MWIVKIALRRPYTFVVASITIFILTPYVLLHMPVDILPPINIPVVSVVWTYSGLRAQEVEQRIVYNHERMIATIVNDIEHIESTSYRGVGVIKVFFREGASIPQAVAQITASAQTILRTLPPGITPPFILQYNASNVPILQYSIASKQLSEQELQDIAMNRIKVGLSTVQGSSIPMPAGGKVRVVAVDLDMSALEANNLTPQDVVAALNAQNLILPGGSAKIGNMEYDVTLNSSPSILSELNNIPIKTTGKAVICIKDVAHVHDGSLPQENIVRLDGVRGVLMTILKSGIASTLSVVDGVKEAIPRLINSLPPSIQVKEFADQSLFVRSAISSVIKEGVIAAALTAIMILLFLGSWRSAFIIATSIPISIFISIIALSALGETINLMTLGGLALAVGILVDDATVEIENVNRQLASGKPVLQAILDGAQEVALPAFVSSLSISIVFVPMFFLTGVARSLFVPLAESVIFAVLSSYILSRTLVPTLVKWFFRNEQHHKNLLNPGQTKKLILLFLKIQDGFEKGFSRFREMYHILLGKVLYQRWIFVIGFIVFCIGSFLLIPFIGQDFFPTVDAGQFRLHIRASTGTRIEETVKLVNQIESLIRREIPESEVSGILDNIGVPGGGIPLAYIDNGLVGTGDADIFVSLKPGHKPTTEYISKIRRKINSTFPGITCYFLPADIVNQTLNFSLAAPIDIQISGRDLNKNHSIAERLAQKLKNIPGIVDVRVQQPADQPELQFMVDRTKASQIGLSERDVAGQILLSLNGSSQTQPNYWLNPANGVQYPVNVRVPEFEINSMNSLNTIPIGKGKNESNITQILANVAQMTYKKNSPIYSHYNVQPVIDIFLGVSGRDLGGILNDIGPLLEEARTQLPKASLLTIRGQAETMRSSFNGLFLGLLIAIILVYLLLVVNFQSWLDPFIIITGSIGTISGVIWGLYLTFTTLSIPALLGAIMSVGVGTANSILVVTFARNNLQDGVKPLNAIWTASTTRLRPVLMTALAMILGMLPLATGIGEGGEQNAALGRAVIGGLTIATFATLFFVPSIFNLLHKSDSVKKPDEGIISDNNK